MIGQKKNLEMIDKWIATGCPQFICISGSRGGGKRMLAKYIADKLGMTYSDVGIKVDDIRETIDSAIKFGGFYVIADADTMSSNAKNAMLKITEEPPKNAYFVLTVEDESSLLDTIKSRAQIMRLEPYTEKELLEYYCGYLGADVTNPYVENIVSIATTPLEVKMLLDYGQDFIDYVNLVIDNIRDVEPANAFKSAGKLALKNEEDKYDLSLFFSAVCSLCCDRLRQDYKNSLFAKIIVTTCKYTTRVGKLGINKQQLYDGWVFEMRSIE